jgi:hypothetical protein
MSKVLKPIKKLYSKNHPHYIFSTTQSKINLHTTFPMRVSIRRGNNNINNKLVCLTIGESLSFNNGLLCHLISIDSFSYNGRTAMIQVQCITHIAS